MQYTAIGDTINTGARLCSVAQPGEIIISSEAMAAGHDRIVAAEMPPVSLKGKRNKLAIFRATGVRRL